LGAGNSRGAGKRHDTPPTVDALRGKRAGRRLVRGSGPGGPWRAEPAGANGGNRRLRPGRSFLVTGCAGFIGSHLVEALHALGCSVVGVDAFIDNYSRGTKERNLAVCAQGGEFQFAQLHLAESPLEQLVDGVEGIFHLAARPGVRTSWGSSYEAYLHDNMLATQRLFDAAAARGTRVVFASSSSIYGDAESYPVREDAAPAPLSPYGVTKLAGESLAGAYASAHGLGAVVLRYFSVYGPRQRPDMAFARVLQCLAEDRPFSVLGGSQTREFTYVGDVVNATLAAMERGASGRAYNVGGGGEISLLEAITVCEEVLGRRLECEYVSAAPGDPRRTSADISRAREELGWSPATSLESGLRAQAEGVAEALPSRAPAGSL
jgi:UDP-glucuronate 4-epimerase